MFAAAGAASVRCGELCEIGTANGMFAVTVSASQTLGESLRGLRVGLPSTIANRTVPEGVVAT
jgi:hypothetical protein